MFKEYEPSDVDNFLSLEFDDWVNKNDFDEDMYNEGDKNLWFDGFNTCRKKGIKEVAKLQSKLKTQQQIIEKYEQILNPKLGLDKVAAIGLKIEKLKESLK